MANNVQFVITVDAQGAVTGIRTFQSALASVGPTAQGSSNQAITAFDRMDKVIGKMQSAVIGFIGAFAFREAIRGIEDIINAGITFESTFAGIRKTVDGTRGDFELLSAQFRDLAKTMPITVDELNRIGQVGGQVGVTADKLKEFTETIAKVGVSSEIPAEEAATSFARLANVLGTDISQVKNFASVMVDLDAKNAASAREILQFSLNLAGAGRRVNMTSADIAALATTLAATGLGAEKAGSAMSRTLIEMNKAVSQNGEKLKTLNEIVAFTGKSFKDLFKADATEGLRAFATGLDNARKSGQDIIPILESLGLKNIRVEDTLSRLSLANGTFTQAIKDARAEAEKNGESLDKRYNMVLETTAAQLQLVKNRIHDVFISLSNELTPSVLGGAKALADFAEFLRNNASIVGGFAFAVGSLGAAFATFKTVEAITAIKGFQNAWAALELIMGGGNVITVLQMTSFPIVGAIAGVIAALTLLGKKLLENKQYAEDIKNANRDREDAQKREIELTMKQVEEYKKYGITIQTQGRDLDQIQNSIRILLPELMKKKDLEKANAEATEEHNKQIDVANKLYAEREARIKKMMDAVTESGRKDNEFIDALSRLIAKGVTANAILDEYGSRIKEIYERHQMLGDAIPPVIDALGGMAEENDKATAAIKAQGVILEAQVKKLVNAREAETAYNKAVEQGIEIAARAGALRALQMSKLPVVPTVFDGIGQVGGEAANPLEDNPMISPELWEKINKRADEAAQHYADEVDKRVGNAVDKVFKRFAEKGRLSVRDMADFLMDTFRPAFDVLLQPLKKGLSDLMKTLIGDVTSGDNKGSGLMGMISKGITGVSNTIANVFGGKDGGKLSSIIGGALSGGIMSAVSVGVNFLVGLFSKSGSEVNNNLVQNIQNPFSKAVSNLMNSFYELNAAGKLTLEKAIDVRTELSGLWTKFKADAADYAAQGSKNATAVKGAFDSIAKYWGTDLSVLFGQIDDTLVQLGGTAGMTADDLTQLTETMKEVNKFTDEVKGLVGSVTELADNSDVLEAALHQLADAGIPTELIVDKLGDTILETAAQMRKLGMEVPEWIAKYEELSKAQGDTAGTADDLSKKLEEAEKNLASLEEQIASVSEQIAGALRQKLEYLDNEIEKSQKSIEGWKDKIADLNSSIEETAAKLQDAEYWQKRYSDIIRESENDLKNATKARQDIEKQIADLEKQIEEDRLNNVLKNAKTETMRKLAQLALDKLHQKTEEDRIKQLEDLKASLKNAIEEEKRATAVYEQKKLAAAEQIAMEKAQLEESIKNKFAERNELLKNIAAEQARISMLEQERTITLKVMGDLGIARQSEIEKMNASIDALMRRKEALEEERLAVEKTIDSIKGTSGASETVADSVETASQQIEATAPDIQDWINQFFRGVDGTVTDFVDSVTTATVTSMNKLQNAAMSPESIATGPLPQTYGTPTGGNPAVPNTPGSASGLQAEAEALVARMAEIRSMPGFGPTTTNPDNPFDPGLYNDLALKGILAEYSKLVIRGSYLESLGLIMHDPLNNVYKLPKFDEGIANVPRTMAAILHSGERVLTAEENRNYTTNNNSAVHVHIGSIVASGARDGEKTGKQIAQTIVRELETDAELRDRLKRLNGRR